MALFRANETLQHRIDDLEVTRVRHESHMQRSSAARGMVILETQVVLHIASRGGAEVVVAPAELGEQVYERLAHHMGQHIETAAVRHRNRDVTRP